jgi:hypothetical protein
VAGPALLFADDVVRAGASHGVMFEIWTGSSSPQHFRELGKLQIEYAHTQPDKRFALVSVVRVTSFGRFEGQLREEVQARSDKAEPYTRATVVVLPTAGFAASVVRGILTGLQLVKPSKAPTATFGSLEDGCAWLAPKLPLEAGRRILASDLVAACGVIAGST